MRSSPTFQGPSRLAHTSDTTNTSPLYLAYSGRWCHRVETNQQGCACAVSLSFLRAIDAVEADAFSALEVEDFECVAVNYPDYSSGEVGGDTLGRNKRYEEERTRKRTQSREVSAFSGRLGAGDTCCILDQLGQDESRLCPRP